MRCKSPRIFRPRLKTTFALAVVAATLCVFAAGCAFLSAQTQNGKAVSLDASRIIPFLNQTLGWYRQRIADQQLAADASEQVLAADNRQLADQIVRAAFDFARAEAEAVNSSLRQAPPQSGTASQEQAMLQAEQRMDQQIAGLQSELSSLNVKLSASAGKQRQLLQAQITETQSEIDLAKTRKSAIQSMVAFVNGIGTPGENTGILGQIDALAASVPSLVASSANANQNASKDQANVQSNANTEAAAGQPAGIWELGAELFGIAQKLRTIDTAINQTDTLTKTVGDLRTPLVVRLRQLSQQSDQLANAPPSKDPATIAQQRQEADAITAEYKQLAAIAVPLSKVSILLGLFDKSLENWHTEVRGDVRSQVERLLARLLVLAVFIGFVLVLAEIAKRTIYRYVHEPHRRYQFLLLRKIAMAVAIVVIVGLAFASRLESAVTYAGLLTAGIAVALQNVIVALVGYFFLIGRYGIRVGDRVQISGVTGEVVDIGLVRMQVMEMGGSAADTPTGRVVAFSNSVVFQPTAGIFRQIPGTNFVWHQVSLTVSADSDFKVVRERLLRAVESVLADYHEELERQNRAMERSLISAPPDGLRPKIRLRLTPTGLEAVIFFPVDLAHAVEIDERVTRELMKAVDQEPKLRLAGSAPSISLRSDLPAAGAAAG
jgi:small-conductance mechanosensitive channel